MTVKRLPIMPALVGAAAAWLVTGPLALATPFGSGINHACDTSYASQCVADNASHRVRFFDVGNQNLLGGTLNRMSWYNSAAGDLNMIPNRRTRVGESARFRARSSSRARTRSNPT